MASQKQVIVSLTSFPAAIPYCIQAIKSILNGSILPDKVVLYLTASQFPGQIIPTELERLAETSILDVRFYSENIRSYTKLIPALKDFHNDIIVTIDDDIWYHKDMLKDLLRHHKKYPKSIVGHRVRHLKLNTPYHSWKRYKEHRYLLKSLKPRFTNIQTGVGGVLYPPNSLDTKMLNSSIFMGMAPSVDDIWFWAAAVSQGTKIAPVPFGKYKLNELNKPKEIGLFQVNEKSGNDVNRVVVEKILAEYPEIKEKIDREVESEKNIFTIIKQFLVPKPCINRVLFQQSTQSHR